MRQIVAEDDPTRNFPTMKAGIDEVKNVPCYQILKIRDRSLSMTNIQELATLTSRGQITLPKFVRQALGVAIGGKVAFELHGRRDSPSTWGNSDENDIPRTTKRGTYRRITWLRVA